MLELLTHLVFVKAPIVIVKGTEADTNHIMDPIQEFSGVSNLEQLKKIAQAQFDLGIHPQ